MVGNELDNLGIITPRKVIQTKGRDPLLKHTDEPDEATIENIDGPFEDFHEIQKAIDCDVSIAGYFSHAVFVEDEGLFRRTRCSLDGPLANRWRGKS